MIITIELLREWGACYFEDDDDEDTLRAFFPGRDSVTPREVADNDQISHEHRMWALTHALWARDPWLCYDFSLWAAEDALAAVPAEWQERGRATLDGVRGLREKPAEAAWAAEGAARAAARAAAEKRARDKAVEMLEAA